MMRKTIEAVFISDLHLHPNDKAINKRFDDFIQWAAVHTRAVYILGDFFHVWAGDDSGNEWSDGIAKKLSWLASKQVVLYFMHGNRDFLIGEQFAKAAQFILLPEPTVIQLGNRSILLAHGDSFCTKDKSHQWLRRITRNKFFPKLFLKIPLKFRKTLVQSVRNHSQHSRRKPYDKLDVVPKMMINALKQWNSETVIHGHIHRAGINIHFSNQQFFRQIVLGDWDDKPFYLCYDRTKGFYFSLG